ncbi:MAG: hypothetical protein GW795_06440 [Cyanobacteria bacterium]|nr:hypothetical protein [Cyanobacteria bacterium CG_2015-16_32_12]NCQ05278.1 hypothetical protein [Cyanobacteria bacterium CG_2015-09_32_10]NCQ41522.1 hypothetical protein [Cyanobacteria bacterium CG_2015-04_32_10]NCS85853.1 hypothetical protein [Cyanobacteria bacterium CG_2015-02_32_10]
MNFSMKLFGVGAISLGCTALFVNTISVLGFQYELLFFIVFLAIGLCILSFAGLALAMAVQAIGMLLIEFAEYISSLN